MSDRSFIRPIRIPGKRFVLTKNMIEESQKHSKSNMEAARWLKVSYNTYKKWAKYYNVFDNHINQAGVGIKKGWGTYKIKMEDIFSGNTKCNYPLSILKKRLVEEGWVEEECGICKWNESLLTDNKICLKIDFVDGSSENKSYENMRLLCPNCYLSFNGMFEKSRRFCK